MIKSIKSNNKDFKTVTFKEGFNVVLAERTLDSTDKDSRNGVGKSTLIEIIHFCLGSDLSKTSFLALNCKNHSFTIELELQNNTLSATRSIENPNVIQMYGDFSSLPVKPKYDEHYKSNIYSIEEWKGVLGQKLFNLNIENGGKYNPSFRTLISYFIRKGVGAFIDPFKYFPDQPNYSVQVHNNFLLNLDINHAISFQKIKDEKESFNIIRKNINDDSLNDILGSVGELQAERVRLTEESIELDLQIKSFKVHTQYKKIQEEADLITGQIHALLNDINLDQRILAEYKNSLVEEEDVSADKVAEVYSEAGLVFDKKVMNRLTDVRKFHDDIVKNRKEYLSTEITRINKEIKTLSDKVEDLSNKRSGLVSILETHNALDEYSYIQNRSGDIKRKLENVKTAIERLNKFEENKSNLKIKLEELMQNARMDNLDRTIFIDKAVSLFNQYSKYLYDDAGTLSISIEKSGYRYKVDIKGSQSQGIQYMKVFCYDLTFTALMSGENKSLFLIHDSTIFDGVDERQRSKALELAHEQALKKGYQYICALNSDNVPYKDFTDSFQKIFNESIVLTLKDGDDTGTLLGFRI